MVMVKIKKGTLNKLQDLFKDKPKKIIKTRSAILKAMDNEMRECLVKEDKKRKERNYSEAIINENYFFALFYLRENILGRNLNVHKERRRLRKFNKQEVKNE